MEEVKVVLADIDGTLTEEQRPIGQINQMAMKALHQQGILVGLASGRRVDQKMKSYASLWDLDFSFDLLIGMNGGELYLESTKQLHRFYQLETETMKEIIEMMEPLDLNPFVYCKDGMLVKRMDAPTIQSLKRNGFKAYVAENLSDLWKEKNAKICFRVPEEKMPEVYAYAQSHPSEKYHAFLTQTTMLEFADPHVNKGMAVEQYCQLTGTNAKHIWAFGDMENDNEMLQVAGRGICLKNGSEKTKAIADAVTEHDCQDNGFGHYLYDHLLNLQCG